MSTQQPNTTAGHARADFWRKVVTPFKGPDSRRSTVQLTTTVVCFIALWVAMYFSLQVSYFLTLALAIPTAGFLVRLFMIQHDCGHGSYFQSKPLRDAVGFCIGVLTLTPYHYWRKTHAYHHSHAGNLDFRDFGDIMTITVKEYEQKGFWGRVGYRLYRHPFVILGVGPVFHFVVKHRYPWDIPKHWKDAWSSVWWTNLVLAVILLVAHLTIGLGTFLMIQAPITITACSIGVWLFYVQHQFEDSYWHHTPEWNYYDAAIHGSSYLVLPRWLQWMTANIGLHHVHHLNSQIPNYKLEDCYKATPELQQVTKLRLRDTLRLMHLALWDEEKKQLVGFREFRRRQQQQSA